jgi:dolichol-phosphate mannosyltransferase
MKTQEDQVEDADALVKRGSVDTSVPDYSVVVPFYNEEAAAPLLLGEIASMLRELCGAVELLCIDDGSRDGTRGVLAAFAAAADSPVRVISFAENKGQAAALWAGLLEARGRVVITLDGDGQNDPADIPALVRKLDRADLVCGIRATRNDSALRRIMSRLANRVRGRILGDKMQDSGCAVKAMRREVVDALIPIRTLYSFIPAMAVAGGFRLVEIPVRHRPRMGGKSNYGFLKFAVMPLVDMLGLLWFRTRCVPTAVRNSARGL